MTHPPLRLWILDPFHTGSHASWSKGMCQILQEAGHEVTMHTLPGRHWKWRMHGAAATWAPLMKDAQPPHVVITTDMCDVAQLKGLMPRTWRDVQVVTMFHENQLTFPWSPDDPDRDNGRDNTYAYVNLSTVMASDQVWFNSHHHMNVFFEAAQQWMDAMPKPHVPFRSEHMRAKSHVMHLGFDLQGWERHRGLVTTSRKADVPTILWNHRWAWDKGTNAFLSFAREILERNIPAQFVILGQSFARRPDGWDVLQKDLDRRCLQWGYAESKEAYISWLWECDIVPVEPHQEYFGLSVVEAMRCEVMPWVPNAHAYPETTPNDVDHLSSDQWIEALIQGTWQRDERQRASCREQAMCFDWSQRAPAILQLLTSLAAESR